MKPQVLVTYTHPEKKLFFISAVNQTRVGTEDNIERQYSRARSLHKGIKEQSVKEHGGGFFYALINTNFSGWESSTDDKVYETPHTFLMARQNIIDKWLADGWSNVGSDHARMKGEYGTNATPYRWNKKFNVSRMTRADIDEKINHIFKALDHPIENYIKNEVYYSIVLPDSHGPIYKNFGSYSIDSLANIFLYTRQLLGLDLDT